MKQIDDAPELEPANDEEHTCLHCYLWAAIEQYHDDTDQIDPNTGQQIWEANSIVAHLIDVAAQIIAAHPRHEHDQILTEATNYFRERVAEFHEKGLHPQVGPDPRH